MDENLELLKFIYQNSEMGTFTCTKLIRDINNKDNLIKKDVEELIKDYEYFLEKSEKLIHKYDVEVEENSFMTKMGSSMGIKMEVKKDNSDTAISKMLIEGVNMGILEMETKIKRYKKTADKKVLKLASEFLKMQEEWLEELKKYL